jgi:GDP-D-mannose dehydratase
MNKRVFITGVSGFLGSRIAQELIKNGFELIALNLIYLVAVSSLSMLVGLIYLKIGSKKY